MPSAVQGHDPLSGGPDEGSHSIPSHPLGVKPLGNQFLFNGPDARRCLGNWASLSDEILTVVLENLDKCSLLVFGCTCKFFYALCRSEELWKTLYLESQLKYNQSLKWQGSWRSSVLGFPSSQLVKVDCGEVFSDVLHRPFACSNIILSRFITGIPRANQIRRFENLAYEEYAERWTEQPFILTKCIQDWPVFSQWTIERLLQDYADVEFRAEVVDWPLSRYCHYMNNNEDESPLYLFDRMFVEKMGIKVGRDAEAVYWRPECFGPDLFEALGDERPAHRWLVIGPERSGSTFHKDPNGTSAWNAVIQGAKYWIMFPPATQVPGVYVSQDNSEVTSPLSIAEWLLAFHEEARQIPECVEGICKAGEILYVPSGWWHLVVNTEKGVALTQNFVAQSPNMNLVSEVLSFLRDRPDQVTGFARDIESPFELFTERLKIKHPNVLERALELADKKHGKKRKWDTAVGRDGEQHDKGFSFGFGDDDEEVP